MIQFQWKFLHPRKKLCSILLLTFVVGVLDKMGISFLEQYHRQAIQMIESWNVSSSAKPQSSHFDYSKIRSNRFVAPQWKIGPLFPADFVWPWIKFEEFIFRSNVWFPWNVVNVVSSLQMRKVFVCLSPPLRGFTMITNNYSNTGNDEPTRAMIWCCHAIHISLKNQAK